MRAFAPVRWSAEPEELRLAREHGARPMLNQLHGYLLTIREQMLPKSVAGQAIAYTLNNWTALTRYCGDGDLTIDNNAAAAASLGSDSPLILIRLPY